MGGARKIGSNRLDAVGEQLGRVGCCRCSTLGTLSYSCSFFVFITFISYIYIYIYKNINTDTHKHTHTHTHIYIYIYTYTLERFCCDFPFVEMLGARCVAPKCCVGLRESVMVDGLSGRL